MNVTHGSETPHGGIVIHANDGYYIEMVYRTKKRVDFYLLDKDEISTIEDEKLKGTAELELKDKSKKKLNLLLLKDMETLRINFDDRKLVENYSININYNGKNIRASFHI